MVIFSSSTAFEYASPDGERFYSSEKVRERLNGLFGLWREISIVLLCMICALLALNCTSIQLSHQDCTPEVSLIRDPKTHKSPFWWSTDIYSSAGPANDAVVDAAWEKIRPAHGFVALDHRWAAENNLPPTLDLPADHSKGVYIIDAYHQIHCLTVIRRTMMEIAAGKPPSTAIEHSRHCFDSLLQYVVCGTDGDTLLYTWGKNTTGNGQPRNCIDWSSRRNWAKDNTACYVDGDHPMRLIAHFNHCENDDDGIQDYWG